MILWNQGLSENWPTESQRAQWPSENYLGYAVIKGQKIQNPQFLFPLCTFKSFCLRFKVFWLKFESKCRSLYTKALLENWKWFCWKQQIQWELWGKTGSLIWVLEIQFFVCLSPLWVPQDGTPGVEIDKIWDCFYRPIVDIEYGTLPYCSVGLILF